MQAEQIRDKLTEKELKVTPQRLAVYDAVASTSSHPTAVEICEFTRQKHPNIATGTVYNILDTFVNKNLIKKVNAESRTMRYDVTTPKHHHLYCHDSDKIEDYFDKELDNLLKKHFAKKKIKNFRIKDINLQITGEFVTKIKNNGRTKTDH